MPAGHYQMHKMTQQEQPGGKLPATMKAVRQKEPGGALVTEMVPLPAPGKGEVLVRMHAAPVNPSDLALLKGGYMERQYPFTPGLEGSGLVVASGRGLLALLRKGKRVACTPAPSGDGTWAEYMVTPASRTAPLPGEASFEQGSMMLVNPMTAMAFMEIAGKGKHRALVNNAAGSELGRMLIRLTGRQQLPLINIVRRKEQVSELMEGGAHIVLCSGDPGFGEQLRQAARDLGATLLLDAIGGEQTSLLMEAAPKGSRLICYARLSGDPIRIDPGWLIKEEKTMEGFLLGNWLRDQPLTGKLRLLRNVRKALPDLLSSRIHRTLPLDMAGHAVDTYHRQMSAGKTILRIAGNHPHSNQ